MLRMLQRLTLESDTMRPRSTLPDILLAVAIGAALAFTIAYNI